MIFLVNRKEPEPELEPQFVISASAPGGNLISAPRLRNTAQDNADLSGSGSVTLNPGSMWKSQVLPFKTGTKKAFAVT